MNAMSRLLGVALIMLCACDEPEPQWVPTQDQEYCEVVYLMEQLCEGWQLDGRDGYSAGCFDAALALAIDLHPDGGWDFEGGVGPDRTDCIGVNGPKARGR